MGGRGERARRHPHPGRGHHDPLRGASQGHHAVDPAGPRVDAMQSRVELVADPDSVTGREDRVRPVPDADGAVVRPVAGSSLVTVRSSELATHTAVVVTAMPAGPAPTGTGALTPWETGSTRETVPSWLLATQTACPPTAMPSGRPPTSMFLAVTTPLAG